MIHIIIYIIISIWQILYPNKVYIKSYYKNIQSINADRIGINNSYKDSIISFIPIHEGTRYYPYSCSAGHITIGCGHIITKKDNHLIYPINQSQVDSLILNDINKANYYYEYYINDSIKAKLTPNQKWAIVHLIFCKGIGNFNNSTLKQLIIKDKSINNEIIKWCNYHTSDGKLVKSKWSYNIRLVELRLYNTGKLLINKNFN